MYSYLKFVKHVFLIGFTDFLSSAQSLVFLPIITKILGAEDFGIWSQIKVTMGLLVPFTFLGLHEALTRFLPGAKDAKEMQEGIYSSSVVVFSIAFIFSIFLVIFSVPISLFLKFDSLFVYFLAAIIIFESLNTILFIVVRSLREIGKYFWFTVLKMLGETALVILAILMGYGLKGAVAAFLLIRIIIFLVLSVYAFFKVGIKMPDFSLIKSYLNFGMPTMLSNISYWVVTSADRYCIAFFLGILFVGYYVPAYSMGTILTFFIFPLALMLSVVLPKFYDEGNMAQVKDYLSRSLKYFLLLMIPSAVGISVLSKQLLSIFSTQEIAKNAYFVVPFVAASTFLYGVSYFFSQILVLRKKTKFIAGFWLVSAVLNLSLNIILIPRFGILAAAITTFLAYLCSFILIWYFSFKEFSFNIDWIFIVKIFMISAVMGTFVLCFKPYGLAQVIISIILAGLLYFALMFFFKTIGKKEIIFLKDLIYEMAFFRK
jgi:O-antigen/teichoic acid export membrane protein